MAWLNVSVQGEDGASGNLLKRKHWVMTLGRRRPTYRHNFGINLREREDLLHLQSGGSCLRMAGNFG